LPLVAALVVTLTVLVTIFYGVNDVAKVIGPSMEPTLRGGDRVLITKGYATAARGDVIWFRAVIDGKPDTLIKRVIALPGDIVEIVGDRATVNGIESPYDATSLIGPEVYRIDPVTVPDAHVYVLGDNRAVSLDSRFIGPVPLIDVRGKVTWIFSPVTRFRRIDADGSGS